MSPSVPWIQTKTWITQASFVNNYMQIRPVYSQDLFDNTRTYIVVDRNNPAPSGWSAVQTILYTAYSSFSLAVRNGTIAPAVKAVIYDNEPQWDLTPENEKQDPDGYTQMFASLAHQHGYRFISAPGGKVVDANGPGTYFTAGARYADTLDIQIQRTQTDPSAYRAKLQQALAVAKQISPNVETIAETTSNIAYVSSPDEVAGVIDAEPRLGGRVLALRLRRERRLRSGELPNLHEARAALRPTDLTARPARRRSRAGLVYPRTSTTRLASP